MLGGSGVQRGVLDGKARAPLGVPHHRGAALRIGRHAGEVGGFAQQRHEAETLLAVDPEPAMPSKHVVVATMYLGIGRRSSHHLAPPVGDVLAMFESHRASEDRAEQVVNLDQVVERLEPPPEHRPAANPLEDRRCRCRSRVQVVHVFKTTSPEQVYFEVARC